MYNLSNDVSDESWMVYWKYQLYINIIFSFIIIIEFFLFDIVKDSGSSLILVTHDTKIANKAHKKIEINDGKIV